MIVFDKALAGTDLSNNRNMASQFQAIQNQRMSVPESSLWQMKPQFALNLAW